MWMGWRPPLSCRNPMPADAATSTNGSPPPAGPPADAVRPTCWQPAPSSPRSRRPDARQAEIVRRLTPGLRVWDGPPPHSGHDRVPDLWPQRARLLSPGLRRARRLRLFETATYLRIRRI